MQSFEYWRDEAAQALGLDSLPVELTTTQIARLYTQNAARCRNAIEKAIQTGALKARMPTLVPAMTAFPRFSGESSEQYWRRISLRLNGLDSEPPPLIHVTDFAAWAGKPPIPEGEAGERVRAWLSLAQAAEMAASAETLPPAPESDGGCRDCLPLFAAINAVLGIPERNPRGIPDEKEYRLTKNGISIYGLIDRHRRAGLEIPVRTRPVGANGCVRTYYCLRDVIVWVRRELPEVQISEDAVKRLDAELRRCMDDDPERIDAWKRYAIKIPLLEKKRAKLEATTPQTPSEWERMDELLAEIDREIAALKKHGHIAEPPAQVAESVAVEGAAKVVATPARGKPKRGVTRKDALLPFIAEAVDEWCAEHRGGWPLAADVLRVLRGDYESGSECGVIERVTEDGIEWRPPNAEKSKTADLEALRKRLERMHKRKKCNAVKVRTDAMDAID